MVTSRIWFTGRTSRAVGAMEDGQSAAAISRALERKNKTGVERIVALHGGIGPAPRRRALAALRFEEREEISVALRWAGRSGRSPRASDGRAIREDSPEEFSYSGRMLNGRRRRTQQVFKRAERGDVRRRREFNLPKAPKDLSKPGSLTRFMTWVADNQHVQYLHALTKFIPQEINARMRTEIKAEFT